MKQNASAESAEPQFLPHSFRIEGIPAQGIDGRVEADAGQRAAIADALDLADLERLVFTYRLRRSGKERFKLDGEFEARATQICVVTLEPMKNEFSQDVSVDFWPRDDIAQLEREEASGETEIDPDGPEPIENGVIDVGQLVYELLASGLDPYPRKADAAVEWEDAEKGTEDKADNPFSALRSFKSARK